MSDELVKTFILPQNLVASVYEDAKKLRRSTNSKPVAHFACHTLRLTAFTAFPCSQFASRCQFVFDKDEHLASLSERQIRCLEEADYNEVLDFCEKNKLDEQ